MGSRLAVEIQRQFKGQARLIGIYDKNQATASKLSGSFRPSVPILSVRTLFQRCQLIIEAASPSAVAELLPLAVAQRKSMVIMSSGGLIQNCRLFRKALAKRIPIYVPSGAVVGIDGIKAGFMGKLRSVTLTTRKPPRALQSIRLETLRRPKIIFQGSALDAIKAFPQNINVAATLSLAGIGSAKTFVRLIADPSVRTNTHEIKAVGDFGTIYTRAENVPSPDNPRTSHLAVLSAIACLKQIFQPVRVGT